MVAAGRDDPAVGFNFGCARFVGEVFLAARAVPVGAVARHGAGWVFCRGRRHSVAAGFGEFRLSIATRAITIMRAAFRAGSGVGAPIAKGVLLAGEGRRDGRFFSNVGVISSVPTVEGVVAGGVRRLCGVVSRRGCVAAVFHGFRFQNAAVPVLPCHGVALDLIIKLRRVYRIITDNADHGIPAIGGVVVLRVVLSGRGRAVVIIVRVCIMRKHFFAQHGAVPVLPDDGVGVNVRTAKRDGGVAGDVRHRIGDYVVVFARGHGAGIGRRAGRRGAVGVTLVKRDAERHVAAVLHGCCRCGCNGVTLIGVVERHIVLVELPHCIQRGVVVDVAGVAGLILRFGGVVSRGPAEEMIMRAGGFVFGKRDRTIIEFLMLNSGRILAAVGVIVDLVNALKVELIGTGRHISVTVCCAMIGLCADQVRSARRKFFPDEEVTVVGADKIVVVVAAVIVCTDVCTVCTVGIAFIDQHVGIRVRVRCAIYYTR